ncbi:MAG: PAS domain-containing protein [Deltaproteobacteria bacterium]|nr:PAS domain-containing protein [Kofleriaceae bacterium]
MTHANCRELVQTHDWASSPLGPIERWPRSLRSYVSMILDMPSPAIIFWGPQQLQIYNDGYAVIMGPRHPRYFGAAYRDCWPDTYPVIYPWMVDVLERGAVKVVERTLFTLTRHGFAEEAYFTFTFSPLRDDADEIAGILQPVVEVTDVVLADRRAATLRALAAHSGATTSVSGIMSALASNPHDMPFAVLCVEDVTGSLAMAGEHGLDGDEPARARAVAAARRLLDAGRDEALDEVQETLGRAHVGPWPEPTHSMIAVPLRTMAGERPLGALVLGLSPRLAYDEPYRSFVHSVAQHVAVNLAAARSVAAEASLLAREHAARREAELHREHLMSLLTQAPTPIALLRGPSFVIELANPHTCQLWGRTPEQVLGQPLMDALPELRGQVFEALLDRVYASGVTYVSETPLVAALDRSGSGELEERHLTFVYSPLRLASGEIDGILVIAFDVTEQVRARDQVDHLRIAAEAANQAKDEFLAILGHELRNPLAPILTAVSLLRMRAPGSFAREVDVIDRQATHLVRLVDDLLDVSRITRGKIELRKERIELARVLDRAIEMVGPLLEERQHDLSVHVARAGLAVEVDAGRLAQVLANLLSNAAKYTEKRGTITVTASEENGEITVTVGDNGMGIDPIMLPRVFDLFVQESQALDRARGGLGLGLAIVRRLVELHGGRVDARSDGRGHGSAFSVTLPAAADPPATGAAVTPPGISLDMAARCRILVVDDNQDAADLLAAVLTDAGHDARVAYDGPSALRAAEAFAPEVALLDIGLPIMDGYELARRLRSQHHQRVRLVAVTGYGQPSDRDRARAAGFEAHLVKPISIHELSTALRELLEAR